MPLSVHDPADVLLAEIFKRLQNTAENAHTPVELIPEGCEVDGTTLARVRKAERRGPIKHRR